MSDDPLKRIWDEVVSPMQIEHDGHIAEMRYKIQRLKEELAFFQEQLRKVDSALEEARAAPPAPALVALLGPLPVCPTCGAGEAWRSRGCCPLGTLVGQVEGRLVAEVLMEKDA